MRSGSCSQLETDQCISDVVRPAQVKDESN